MAVTQESPQPLAHKRRYADRLNTFAGTCYGETAPKSKQIALALDLSESRVSRVRNGSPSGTPQRFYHDIQRLASSPKTDPAPLIAGAYSAWEGVLAHHSPEALRAEILPLMDAETEAQMTEDMTSHRVIRLMERWAAGDDGRATKRDLIRALFLWETALRRETSKQIRLETWGRILRYHLEDETGYCPDLRR